MSTGIFRHNIVGELEEIALEHINYWCSLCQFPLSKGQCQDKALIQRCWDYTTAVAGEWHIQHECPFIHREEPCRCNAFETIEEAFLAAGLEYKRKEV